MTNSIMSLKLLVNKRDRKIVFAEANKDFVDFLFYILTLPIGAITKLLAKEPLSGSLGDLYQSIENLNDMYILQNKTKDTVLNPKSSSYVPDQDLLLIPKELPTTERKFYRCSANHRCKYVTDEPKTECPNCRWDMSEEVAFVGTEAAKVAATAAAGEAGFVKEVVTYMVMDDLVVKPMSTISYHNFAQQVKYQRCLRSWRKGGPFWDGGGFEATQGFNGMQGCTVTCIPRLGRPCRNCLSHIL